MKLFKTFLYLCSFTLMSSCGQHEKDHSHKEYDEFKKEINDLKVKLEATEAQLLNVRSELARTKANDSTKTKTEE